MIVVDTDVIAYLLIEGERTPAARQVWATDPVWRAPPLWRTELLSVLVTSVRAGVLDTAQAAETWRRATALLGTSEVQPSGEAVLSTAIRDGLSAYDAQFMVVADQLDVTLVTQDNRVLKARADRAISMEAFAAKAGT